MAATIAWNDFDNVDLRVGTIVRVEDFPNAVKKAYKVWVDLGPEIGIKASSAQITIQYSMTELIDKQVICVCNFPPKQVADFISEVLITGFILEKGRVILAQPESLVPNGTRLA